MRLLLIIKTELSNIILDIDSGNSNLTEDELVEVVDFLKMYRKDAPITKYQAFNYLGISRATFDNLVAKGILPKGEKLYQGDTNLFWYKKDLDKYKKDILQGNC